MNDFNDKVAVITGAASSIGFAAMPLIENRQRWVLEGGEPRFPA